ncbi:hypothetical protein [Massilia sp. PWRC2]|uniref:hypothetical protein n=1 Tax=Massilia sp. PWRC2 TaxID=2804626 RepID=UPI003CEF0C53
MNPEFIADLVAQLESIDADAAVKKQIRYRLYKVGAMHGVRPLRQMERVDFASHLLELAVSVSTIRDRLMATFKVGDSQAYRDVQKALNLRHLTPLNGTPRAENGSIEKRLGVLYDK